MLWAHGLRSCLRNPILGHGEGAADLAGLAGHGFHNGYLRVWYDTGVFGLLAVVSFLVIYVVKAWRRFREARSEETADFARVALGYLLGIIPVGFFVDRLGGGANISICLLLIMCVLIDRLKFIEAPKLAYHQRVDEQPLLARYGVQAWSSYQAAR